MAAYRRLTFEDDEEEIELIVQMQRRPRVLRERVNFLEMYDDVDFMDRFRLSKATFGFVLGAIERQIAPPSRRWKRCRSVPEPEAIFQPHVPCICDAGLKIMNIVSRWPGSCHDQTIFDNSSAAKFKFENGEIRGCYLLGDGGYEVTPYLMTPLAAPITRAQQLYNESHIRTRNVIERCFGVVKKRFPVLSKGITVEISNVQAIIVACAVLHNICIGMHDDLPDPRNDQVYDGSDDNCDIGSDSENDEPYAPSYRGRQERDRLVNDYFANLE